MPWVIGLTDDEVQKTSYQETRTHTVWKAKNPKTYE